MFETFFMKYREPVKYGIIKAMQFNLLDAFRPVKRVHCPYDLTIKPGGYVPPEPINIKIHIDSDPLEPEVKKKKKDPTKDYDWPAAVNANGGLRGSKATSRKRFR